ncbi:MAG TPA: GNAT family N-acetyltransferase [Chitinophaga sp.]
MDHGPNTTMIRFSHLQNITLPELCSVFNLAFSDYIIPFQLTVPLLEQKLQGENVRLSHCIGAFDGPTLAGFILHGADTWPNPALLYNGGTGVIPAYRGQHLVQRMYAHYRQQYKQEGVQRILLEVISTNTPAIKAYENSGFTKTRFFYCYKGQPFIKQVRKNITIRTAATPDWALLNTFTDQAPGWANSPASIQREGQHTLTWLAYEQNEIAGFISVFGSNKRIRQLGVHPQHRRKGIGSALLQHVIQVLQGPFSIINITDDNKGLQQFLLQAGFEVAVKQWEMELNV